MSEPLTQEGSENVSLLISEIPDQLTSPAFKVHSPTIISDTLSEEKEEPTAQVDCQELETELDDESFLDENIGVASVSSPSDDALQFHKLVDGMAMALQFHQSHWKKPPSCFKIRLSFQY